MASSFQNLRLATPVTPVFEIQSTLLWPFSNVYYHGGYQAKLSVNYEQGVSGRQYSAQDVEGSLGENWPLPLAHLYN